LTEPLWLGRAEGEDAPRLAALEADCYTHPWTLKQFSEEVSYGSPGAVLVLRGLRPSGSWGDVRGYCVYRLVVDEMHILNVAVAPPLRRRGLARWMLHLAIARAARDGARKALLEVRGSNLGARALYRGLGFEAVGRRPAYYSEPREDAVLLSLGPLPGERP
jgi:ribosomal-protein-alanine N-acetyltransferase